MIPIPSALHAENAVQATINDCFDTTEAGAYGESGYVTLLIIGYGLDADNTGAMDQNAAFARLDNHNASSRVCANIADVRSLQYGQSKRESQ